VVTTELTINRFQAPTLFIPLGEKALTDEEIHKRDLDWLKQSDGEYTQTIAQHSLE